MCDTCTTATQHFTSGTTPSERPLQTSVEQGTSPDWAGQSLSSADMTSGS